jgi:hypothetical protein
MTKNVRIENADTSAYPVRVTVQDKNAAGEWVDVETLQLNHPTAMAERGLTNSRRLIVEEAG